MEGSKRKRVKHYSLTKLESKPAQASGKVVVNIVRTKEGPRVRIEETAGSGTVWPPESESQR